MSRWIAVSLAVVLLSLSSAAGAQSLEEAEKVSERAKAAYNKEHFQEALALFKEAYALYPSERYLFNCAKTCVRLQDMEGAVYYYERYLTGFPMASDKADVTGEIGRIKEALAAAGFKEIRLRSTPAGAKVLVAPAHATEVATTPGSLFVKPGTYTVTFSLDGYKRRELNFEVDSLAAGALVAEATLEKEETMGWLELSCTEAGAKVFVGGTYIAATPLPAQMIQQGKYKVRVAKQGFKTTDLEVQIQSGQVARLDVALVPLDPIPAKTKPVKTKKERTREARIALWSVGGAGLLVTIIGAALWGSGYNGLHKANDRYGEVGYATYEEEFLKAKRNYRAGQWLTLLGGLVAVTGAGASLGIPNPKDKTTSVGLATEPGGLSVSINGTF